MIYQLAQSVTDRFAETRNRFIEFVIEAVLLHSLGPCNQWRSKERQGAAAPGARGGAKMKVRWVFLRGDFCEVFCLCEVAWEGASMVIGAPK